MLGGGNIFGSTGNQTTGGVFNFGAGNNNQAQMQPNNRKFKFYSRNGDGCKAAKICPRHQRSEP